MKQIINRRKYDTESAVEMGRWDNGLPMNDFNYCSEILYYKKNGEFFIYGDGGANTKYAKLDGDFWMGSEKIIPISYDMAKTWAEKHLTAEQYEKIFGDMADESDTAILHVEISMKTKLKLDECRTKQSKTYREIIEQLVNDNL